MFKVNDLVTVVGEDLRQHAYVGRVEEVDPNYSQHGVMYYVTHLTDEKGNPYQDEAWDADWFFEDQLAAYELRPQKGQWLLCIDAHDTNGVLTEGKRYLVTAVNQAGHVFYVTVLVPRHAHPLTYDGGRFALVVPIPPRW
jgi:hypothetical protein